MEFKCTHCNYPDEDNTLRLIVKDGVKYEFNINEDGSLEHIDTDGSGQEIYLECRLCGTEYEFEDDMIMAEEVFTLKKYDYDLRKGDIIKPVTMNDLKFKKKEE